MRSAGGGKLNLEVSLDKALDCGMTSAWPVALTIAGSDPSGGAGLQGDLKTFHRFGAYGAAVPSLITVQDTRSVAACVPLDPGLVRRQIEAVQEDMPPSAAKTGALGTAAIVATVAEWARASGTPLVVDPILASHRGQALAGPDVAAALAEELVPLCLLATPNLAEAAALAGFEVRDLASMQKAAERIAGLGARNVLVKGGHLDGDAVDILWSEGEIRTFAAARIATRHTHGTGCAFSAAITALLAFGWPLPEAVERAKLFVTAAIRTAPGLGRGQGPLNHHAQIAPG